MKEENRVYPSFEDMKIRHEYTYKINSLFQEYEFNWIAGPALLSPNIFLKPENYSDKNQLNTEILPFQDIIKISLHTKEGKARLGLIAYPSIKEAKYKKNLEKSGYSYDSIEGQNWIIFLVKPLDRLEEVIDELKNLESILLPKHL